MHHIESHVARTANAEHGIEVGSVVVEQSTAAVYHFGYLGNAFFEKTERIGIGHHHGRNLLSLLFHQRA